MGFGRRFAFGALALALFASGVAAQSTRSRRVESKPAGASRTPAVAVDAVSAPLTFAKLPFAQGETLSYNVDWNNYVAAARLELAFPKRGQFFGKEGLQITANVKTVGIVRALLASVDSRSESYLDPKTLLAYRTERSNDVNGKATTQLVTFDRAKNTATSGDRSLAIGAETGDALGLLYRLRAMRLVEGAQLSLDGVEGSKRLEVKASVGGRETVTTPAGQFEALRVACVPVENGEPNEMSRFDIWFSTDPERVPVQIEAQTKVGTIRIALTKGPARADR
jgi:hypothetical protein